VMAANLKALRERAAGSRVIARFDTVAQALTGKGGAVAEDGVEWVRDLARALWIAPLGVHGIALSDVAEIVEKAKTASSMKANPIALTDDELAELLGRTIAGG
jgi:alcohol dehydrogenase class IV